MLKAERWIISEQQNNIQHNRPTIREILWDFPLKPPKSKYHPARRKKKIHHQPHSEMTPLWLLHTVFFFFLSLQLRHCGFWFGEWPSWERGVQSSSPWWPFWSTSDLRAALNLGEMTELLRNFSALWLNQSVKTRPVGWACFFVAFLPVLTWPRLVETWPENTKLWPRWPLCLKTRRRNWKTSLLVPVCLHLTLPFLTSPVRWPAFVDTRCEVPVCSLVFTSARVSLTGGLVQMLVWNSTAEQTAGVFSTPRHVWNDTQVQKGHQLSTEGQRRWKRGNHLEKFHSFYQV